jgi:hypothetical protein
VGPQGERGLQGERGADGVVDYDELVAMATRTLEQNLDVRLEVIIASLALLEEHVGLRSGGPSVEDLERDFLRELEKSCGELIALPTARIEKRIKRDAGGRVIGVTDVAVEE